MVAAYARVYAFQRVAGGVRNIKVEDGSVATLYSDDATASDLYASVTEQSLAIIDLENQQAIAAWGVLAEASGADPAFIGVVSSTLGGYVAIAGPVVALQTTTGGQVKTALKAHDGNVHIADKLYLGDDGLWVFDPVTKTESIRGAAFAKVRGRGFGANGDLTEWTGPNIPLAAMTKANGVRWEDTSGGAYFGGQITAGALGNGGQGTDIGVGVSREVGPFATHGNPIAVAFSYSFTRTARRTAGSPLPANPTADIRLYRKIGVGAETLVSTMNVTGVSSAVQNDINDWAVTDSMSGSQTYTDTAGGTDDRTYRVEVYSRALGALPGSQITASALSQRYGLTTSEN